MKERIQTPKAPNAIGPYSQAIVTDTLVFCSGQGPMDPETNTLVEGDVTVQALRTMQNIKALLGEMGLDFGMHIENFPSRAELDARWARERESA